MWNAEHPGGFGHPGDKDLVHDYVLHDFAKADEAGLDKLLDAVAVELPLLVAGDDKAFMSRVNQALAPPRPKPPKPKPAPKSKPEPEPAPESQPEPEQKD